MLAVKKYLKRVWAAVSHGDTAYGIIQAIAGASSGIVGTGMAVYQAMGPLGVWFSFLGSLALGLFIVNEISARRVKNRVRRLNIRHEDVDRFIKTVEFSPADQLTSTYVRGHHFRVWELVRDTAIAKGRTFEDCHIYGPAILFCFNRTHFDDCMFNLPNNDIEQMIYDVPPRRLVGPIAIDNCVFRRCHFYWIGLMGDKEHMDMVRKGTIFPERS